MATVSWTDASSTVFDEAKTGAKAIVLYFEDKTKGAKWPEDADLVDLQTKNLVACVRVCKTYNGKKNDPPPSKVIRTNKLAANDLWEAFGNPAAGTFIICDENGNEFFRGTDKKLQKNVVALKKSVKERRTKADGLIKKAQKLIDDKNDEGAMKDLLTALKLELDGWDEAAKAVELYNGVMTRVKEKIEAAAGDQAKLKALQKSFKGTDAEVDIDDALKAATVSK
ncbi:MAG: hypothetical protein IT462_04470 [Planctomycetes bacterium]|nr:hypothetical protein [Planctomycetota bacterium]